MEWIVTTTHAILALAVIVGVLFSSTYTQHITILITLLVILFGIRFYKGCFMTQWEVGNKPTLTQIGKALYIHNPADEPSDAVFEEILVSSLVFLHLVRVAASSVLPLKDIFTGATVE